ADFVERFRAPGAGAAKTEGHEEHEGPDVAERRQRSLPFRAYLLWLTFPPMTLLWLDQPFGLVIAYGVLG
ncbi:divalent metal cation transporter, partial [Streptomyces sp. SID7499]|nr:divalent metal cation transporter [Streptomyces sp. SID7499]